MEGAPALIEWKNEALERAYAHLESTGQLRASGVRLPAEHVARLIAAASAFEGEIRLSTRDDWFAGLDVPDLERPSSAALRVQVEAAEDALAVAGRALKPRIQIRNAIIEGELELRGAVIAADVRLQGVGFTHHVTVADSMFEGEARFGQSYFRGAANFRGSRFRDEADFGHTVICGLGNFSGASFLGNRACDFNDAIFRDRADFSESRFAGRVLLHSAVFMDGASFWRARFEADQDLGPMLALGELSFEKAVFERDANVAVASDRLVFRGTSFRNRADLRACWAEMVLDEVEFLRPARLATENIDHRYIDDLAAICQARACRVTRGGDDDPVDRGRSASARLLSLHGADVSNLTVSGLDLRACRFARAQSVARMRIEGDVQFASTPAHGGWTRRSTLAEEHAWRATAAADAAHRWPLGPLTRRFRERRRRGWMPLSSVAPGWAYFAPPPEVQPRQVASIYRALRQGREEAKDEPGAADFYYGEMEMRRHASRRRAVAGEATPLAERIILWFYWLVSGYGLRATRALTALTATIALFGVLFAITDSHTGPEPSIMASLLFALESTTSLLRAPQPDLTELGRFLQVPLRLLGPLFFGLAVLSMRGRVKR